jgi:hypothetical protein
LRFDERALETYKILDKFYEILMEMHKRELLEITFIYRKSLKLLAVLFSGQISTLALQYKRLKYGGS